jgi:hypothetical protein
MNSNTGRREEAFVMQPSKDRKHRLYRVYKSLGMNLRRRGKRRLPARIETPLLIPDAANEVWSIDFMSDALLPGRGFRAFKHLIRLPVSFFFS